MKGKIINLYKNSILRMFGGYFHNFWTEFYGTWEGTLRAFISECSNSELQEAVKELRTLLDKGLSEADMREIVTRGFGANIYPPGFGMTYRSWLELLIVLFEKELKKRKTEEA